MQNNVSFVVCQVGVCATELKSPMDTFSTAWCRVVCPLISLRLTCLSRSSDVSDLARSKTFRWNSR